MPGDNIRPINGRTVTEVKVEDEKPENVPENCFLEDVRNRRDPAKKGVSATGYKFLILLIHLSSPRG